MRRGIIVDEELVQYYIVNKEIHMSPGKLAAQVAHVATKIAIGEVNNEAFQKWFNNDSYKKIVLQAKEKGLLKLIDQGAYFVRDNGITELTPNTLTVVGLKPMTRLEAKNYIKRLQLFK